MEFSLLDLPVNESVESISRDSCSTIASNCVDDVLELFLGVAILELVVDVLHVIEIKLTFSLGIQEGEVGSSSFLIERVALC